MSTEAIEKLYHNFSVLSEAKTNISEHTQEYLEFITAVKGTGKEKILASQFITRFFKHFPNQANAAIDALLDLCEDEDVMIRRHAIKDLPMLCKDNKQYTVKIADILAQLLQADDAAELSAVHNSLMSLMGFDAKGCLGGIFSQILSGDDAVREKCIKFLTGKVRIAGKEVLTKESEDFMIAEIKKVLQDVTAQEFNMLMDFLGRTKLGSTLSGQQELVDLVAEQAEIQQPFTPVAGEENEFLDRLINCFRHAIPYFSQKIPSTKFTLYMIEQVLPQFDKLVTSEDSQVELDLLKLLAELTTHCGPLPDAPANLNIIFPRLLKYLPLPPPDLDDLTQEPRLEFSHVECLMYAFHRLLRQHPDFLKDPEILKDFKLRLQYFARGIQGYIKKLRETLTGKSAEELKSDENKLKVVALKTTNNINILIKDLFHSPPSFKSSITLSWKPVKATETESKQHLETKESEKRHKQITFGSSTSPKRPREIYTPPGGKFSNRIRGPGGSRGRGRGFRRGYGRPY